MSPKAVSGTIQNVLIAPDGRDVLVATSRDVPSGGNRGTVIAQIAQIAEVPASGRGPVRVLRTVTARYTQITQHVLDDISPVLALDPTGRYALVQGLPVRLAGPWPRAFTSPPPYMPQIPVYGVW